jgi:hypothetical protein
VTARPAVAGGGPGLRRRRRPRVPGYRLRRGRGGRPCGGACGRRPARNAHQLTDSLLVRAWGITRRRSDRRGVLLVGNQQLTSSTPVHAASSTAAGRRPAPTSCRVTPTSRSPAAEPDARPGGLAAPLHRLPVPGFHQRGRVRPDRHHAAGAMGQGCHGGAVAEFPRHPRPGGRQGRERVHLASNGPLRNGACRPAPP